MWADWSAWRRLVYEAAKEEIAQELGRAAFELHPDRRGKRVKRAESLKRKMIGFRLCGLATTFRRCGACHTPRLLSGVYAPMGESLPCQGRTCEFCGRRRSARVVNELLNILDNMPRVKGYSVKHIVLTATYDPTNDGDLTVDAILDRVRGLETAARAIWNPKDTLGIKTRIGLKKPGAGLLRKLEFSVNGFLHLHLLYYGPHVVKQGADFTIEDLAKKAYPRAGFAWVEQVTDPYSGEKRAPGEKDIAYEIVKYVCKGPSPLDEEAILGAPRERLNPVLAARLEMALFEVRTLERYGCFRGADKERKAPEDIGEAEERELLKELHEHTNDKDTTCENCGTVGYWYSDRCTTREWLRYSHSRGSRGFVASRWQGSSTPRSTGSSGLSPPTGPPSPSSWGKEHSVSTWRQGWRRRRRLRPEGRR